MTQAHHGRQSQEKVRTSRRSNRASSHPPKGPMNNSNRSAICCPCRRPASCCTIRNPPSVVWSLHTPTSPEEGFFFSRFLSRFPRFLNSGMTHVAGYDASKRIAVAAANQAGRPVGRWRPAPPLVGGKFIVPTARAFALRAGVTN